MPSSGMVNGERFPAARNRVAKIAKHQRAADVDRPDRPREGSGLPGHHFRGGCT